MRKTTKIWLVIAASFVLIGCIAFGSVMSMLKWDFARLSTVKMETNEYEISENFGSIVMDTDTADIVFAASNDGKCKVVCYEAIKEEHSVTVQEDTLVIKRTNEKAWYDYIGVGFKTPKITLYLPKTDYASLSVKESTGDVELPKDFCFENVDISLSTGDVDFFASASESIKIKASTGDIYVENLESDSISLSVSTGKVSATNVNCTGDVTVSVTTGKSNLTNIQCKNLISNGNTGDMSLNNVIATGLISIVRSTGDVKLEHVDGAEIFVKTDTGDVNGSLLTDKVFIVQTDTGRVNIPKTTTGGKCEIYTGTGDIKFTID